MNTSDFIQTHRKALGLTLEELGKRAGVSKSTIKHWEDGNVDNMKRSNIEHLAQALCVSPIQLMGFDENETFKDNNVYVPIIEKIKNKSSILSKDNIKDYRVILKNNVPADKIFIFSQTSDDLKPSILKNDKLLIRVENEVKLNSIVAVLDDEDILLRRVRKVGSMIFLTTNSEEVEPILYDENVKIIGTAIEVIRHFE